MQQNLSWEANRSAAGQEVPCILWKPMVHFRIHKCPPAVPILSQINSIHASPPHLLNTHFNSNLPLHLYVPSGLFPSVVPTKTQYAPLLSPIHNPPITPICSKWSLSLSCPHQNSVCTATLSHTYSSHYTYMFQVVCFPQLSPPKLSMHRYSLPYIPCAPPTSFFFRHNMTMITNSKTNEQKYKITLSYLVFYWYH